MPPAKVRIERIKDERTRQNTYHKRKGGLIKKAMELSLMCECEISLVMKSAPTKNCKEGQVTAYCSKDLSQMMRETLTHLPKGVFHNEDYIRFSKDGDVGVDTMDISPSPRPKNRHSLDHTAWAPANLLPPLSESLAKHTVIPSAVVGLPDPREKMPRDMRARLKALELAFEEQVREKARLELLAKQTTNDHDKLRQMLTSLQSPPISPPLPPLQATAPITSQSPSPASAHRAATWKPSARPACPGSDGGCSRADPTFLGGECPSDAARHGQSTAQGESSASNGRKGPDSLGPGAAPEAQSPGKRSPASRSEGHEAGPRAAARGEAEASAESRKRPRTSASLGGGSAGEARCAGRTEGAVDAVAQAEDASGGALGAAGTMAGGLSSVEAARRVAEAEQVAVEVLAAAHERPPPLAV